MELSAEQRAFLDRNRSAAMVALRRDGTPHAVRVGIALVDGQIWSSGTQGRLRTRLLRRDPRCTLFVFESGYGFLTLEGTVTILDGPDAPDLSLRLFHAMQAGMNPPPAPGNLMWFGRELTPEQFRAAMVEERRLIYRLDVERAYGSAPR
jgi:PPOX class probable F420-dependent enzyme